jgi:hypothetical protein
VSILSINCLRFDFILPSWAMLLPMSVLCAWMDGWILASFLVVYLPHN